MQNTIGKIVKSNSHVDYICQIFGPGEISPQPVPVDYAFGSFVAVELGGDGAAGALIALVYNTQLVNPDFGTYGPRLSSRADLEIFSPDYLTETAILVGLLAVGWRDASGAVHQGVPPLATSVNAVVQTMGEAEMVAFHRDAHGRLRLHYVPTLLAQDNPLTTPLLLSVLDRLERLYPAERARLAVMRNNLAWRRIVAPAG